MLNKEKFAKEIIEIVTSDDNGVIAVDIHTKKLCKCSGKACDDCLFCGNCRALRNKWANSEYIESIRLTLAEKIILENIRKDIKFIVRDNDNNLYLFIKKPKKENGEWKYRIYAFELKAFDGLFQFVKCEDKEPYKIEDILNNCEVVESVD